MWTFIVGFVLLTAGHGAQSYSNNLQDNLFHACPRDQVFSQIESSYSRTKSDRRWKIECKPFEEHKSCSWYVPNKDLSFNCPNNRVITGVYSEYNKQTQDRSWYFFCCSAQNLITFDCRETPMVNYPREDFTWSVPGNNYLTGVRLHETSNRDHRWSFSYCRGTTQDPKTVNSQILAANGPVAPHLVEGDVVVPKTKNAILCSNCKWLKSSHVVQVPYTVSGDFTNSDKATIRDAMEEFESSTCIRFVPHKDQTNYISIVKKTGCWSFVGRIGESQELSLGRGCVHYGIIQHELIHALGFWHEQSRSDRDIYVTIHPENIKAKFESNFIKRETNNLNVPYDYSSVMHYAPKDFSKNGKDTITATVSSAVIGQRDGMTDNDILKINKLYGCRDYLHKNGEWDNQLGNTLNRQCPPGRVVSGIRSFHDKDVKDRLWEISCKAFKSTRSCKWSNYVNQYSENMDFKCADNSVIAGAHSQHSSAHGDRKWKFYCCSASGFSMFNCKETPVINYWSEPFNWKVPGTNFLTGVKSSFDPETRDRRWSFSYCQGKTQ